MALCVCDALRLLLVLVLMSALRLQEQFWGMALNK
jgi:hypothetical protein